MWHIILWSLFYRWWVWGQIWEGTCNGYLAGDSWSQILNPGSSAPEGSTIVSGSVGPSSQVTSTETFLFCLQLKPFLPLGFYKILFLRSFRRGAAEMNPTRNHEVVCLIPGLSQWVKDLAFPWAGGRLQTWLRSGVVWLWFRLAATAPIQLLAWETPYAGMALKDRKKGKYFAPPLSPIYWSWRCPCLWMEPLAGADVFGQDKDVIWFSKQKLPHWLLCGKYIISTPNF